MIQLNRTDVAGEYRGQSDQGALTLRIDVGTENSLDIISGDFSLVTTPGNFEFHHSFQSTGVALEKQQDRLALRCPVKIYREKTIPLARLDLFMKPQGDLRADYTFYQMTGSGRQVAAAFTFTLQKTSDFFRTVVLEMDQVEGVPLPEAFHPDQHPDTPEGVESNPMTLESVFKDAGIALETNMGGSNVPVNLAGMDGLWSDEELHGAMENHFSDYKEDQQWRVYLLLATRYASPSTLGIMFDSGDDYPRQGAAVFYNHPAIRNAPENERNREYLFTMVHELGHAFNMLHAFQKGIFETHGVLPRPGSLSWMNYPQLFPFGYAGPAGWNGTQNFWSQFSFQFDHGELAHLRHNDTMEVVMGGRSFGFAGHLDEKPFERVSAENDVSLTLWMPPCVEFMEQLAGDVRLTNLSENSIQAHPDLHPAAGNLELLVRRPIDRFPKVYRHFTNTCVQGDMKMLEPGESIYQEISPSFGLRHWFVDEPGSYEFQALYHSPDGRTLRSNLVRVRVFLPDREAERLAPDYFDNKTGLYLGVEGSRIDAMSKTRGVLEEVKTRMPQAAVSKQISVVNALRDARPFKDVRKAKINMPGFEGASKLVKALGVSLKEKSVKTGEGAPTNLALSRYLKTAAQAFASEGGSERAKEVLDVAGNMFKALKAPKTAFSDLANFATSLKMK